jgi:hypothetical protein
MKKRPGEDLKEIPPIRKVPPAVPASLPPSGWRPLEKAGS